MNEQPNRSEAAGPVPPVENAAIAAAAQSQGFVAGGRRAKRYAAEHAHDAEVHAGDQPDSAEQNAAEEVSAPEPVTPQTSPAQDPEAHHAAQYPAVPVPRPESAHSTVDAAIVQPEAPVLSSAAPVTAAPESAIAQHEPVPVTATPDSGIETPILAQATAGASSSPASELTDVDPVRAASTTTSEVPAPPESDGSGAEADERDATQIVAAEASAPAAEAPPALKKASKVGAKVGDVLLTVAAVAGSICIIAVLASVFFGVKLIMFKTGSMDPAIPTGSLAIEYSVKASDISVGDIITVDRSGELPITHRVTGITETDTPGTYSMTMRGDANATDDPQPYIITEAKRVLWSIPGAAYVVVWFSNPFVIAAIAFAVALLVMWAFWPRAKEGDSLEDDHGEEKDRQLRDPRTSTT